MTVRPSGLLSWGIGFSYHELKSNCDLFKNAEMHQSVKILLLAMGNSRKHFFVVCHKWRSTLVQVISLIMRFMTVFVSITSSEVMWQCNLSHICPSSIDTSILRDTQSQRAFSGMVRPIKLPLHDTLHGILKSETNMILVGLKIKMVWKTFLWPYARDEFRYRLCVCKMINNQVKRYSPTWHTIWSNKLPKA